MTAPRWLAPAALIAMGFIVLLIVRGIENREFSERAELIVEQVDGAPDAVIFTWRGRVEAPMARALKKAADTLDPGVTRVVVSLDSPGGAVAEGRAAIDVLRRIKRTRRLDTIVVGARRCLSMCVPIFLQGQTRAASGRAKFMFHRPIAVNAVTGERVEKSRFDRDWTSDRLFERYFGAGPVNPEWAARLREEWRDGDVWRRGSALYAENSGIVTDVLRTGVSAEAFAARPSP